jgi:hypothetical protein
MVSTAMVSTAFDEDTEFLKTRAILVPQTSPINFQNIFSTTAAHRSPHR